MMDKSKTPKYVEAYKAAAGGGASVESAAAVEEYGVVSKNATYMHTETIIILDRFRAICPPLSDFEYQELSESIGRDGIRDPLVVWVNANGRVLIDGHNRYDIAEELSIENVPTLDILFRNADEADEWIIRNQMARRNLTDEQRARFISRLYKAAKKAPGRRPDNEGQNDPHFEGYEPPAVEPEESGASAESVARAVGVSAATVKRAEKIDDAMARIGQVSPEAEGKILAGKARKSVNKGQLVEMADASDEDVAEVARAVEAGVNRGEIITEALLLADEHKRKVIYTYYTNSLCSPISHSKVVDFVRKQYNYQGLHGKHLGKYVTGYDCRPSIGMEINYAVDETQSIGKIVLTWANVTAAIVALINTGRYYTPEAAAGDGEKNEVQNEPDSLDVEDEDAEVEEDEEPDGFYAFLNDEANKLEEVVKSIDYIDAPKVISMLTKHIKIDTMTHAEVQGYYVMMLSADSDLHLHIAMVRSELRERGLRIPK